MDFYSWTLLICYSTSLLLVVLYFVREDGLCHYSRRVESAYLSTVLSMIYLASVKFGLDFLGLWERLHGDVPEKPANVLRGLQTIRHLMLIIVLLHIAQKFVVSRVLPTFYDTPGYQHVKREAKLWRIAMTYPKAVRIAGEISDLVHSIVRVDSGLFLDFIHKGAGFVLLVLCMLSEFTAACEGFWRVAALIGDFAEVVIILLTITHFVRRLFFLGARVEKLNELFEEVVQSGREPYLTYILATVSMATCIEVSKNMLEILTLRALQDELLDTTSKAVLIDALQKAGLRSVQRQEAIGRIITSTYGSELTKLKNLIDGRAGYLNLFKLVYQDISSSVVQEKVLRHLQAEANIVQRSPGWRRGVKILSDLDDTLYSSGGSFPAGCDRRFPKGVVYPGCLTLFKVLDKTFNPIKPSCNLVFLSARPHVYKGLMEEKSYQLFRDLLEQERIHTFPTLLPGQLSTGLKAMVAHCCHRRNKTAAWREVGMNKYHIFVKFLRLYQEYDFLFCGDDGQGDLLAAQHMLDEESCALSDSSDSDENLEDQEHERLQPRSRRANEDTEISRRSATLDCVDEAPDPSLSEEVTSSGNDNENSSTSGSGSSGARKRSGGRLRAVLIHKVVFQDNGVPLAREEPSQRGQAWYDELRQRNLIFHRTYVGAAVELHVSHPDLVSLSDLQSVAQDAIEEFEECRLMYPEMAGRWEEQEADLVRDLERANQVLQAENFEKLRRPRATGDFDDSEGDESDDTVAMATRQSTNEWLESGGLAGAGELRLRFVDLMPKMHRSSTRRRRTNARTRARHRSTSREMLEQVRENVMDL